MSQQYYPEKIWRPVWAAFTVLFAVVGLSNCTPRLIRHEPRNAAIAATRFAEGALVTNGVSDTIHLLADGTSPQDDPEAKLMAFISEVKSSGSKPESIWAIEYEPVPGTYFIRIFLVGKDKRNIVTYYSLLMESVNAQDYRVAEIGFNGTIPLPASPLRKPLTN